jgi:hypothetical protein
MSSDRRDQGPIYELHDIAYYNLIVFCGTLEFANSRVIRFRHLIHNLQRFAEV